VNCDYDDWLLEQQENQMKTTSWKTTVTGVLAILAAVATVLKAELDGDVTTLPDWGVAVAAVLAGIGLIAARDNSVTSEQAGAVPPKS
jgi:protein-S-isoprenylcysteine O-methyltransferase Ste14